MMNKIIEFLRTCPTVTTGTITAIVAAGLAVIVAFGADLNEDQRIAVMGLVAVLAPLIAGGITHMQTVPSVQVIAHEDPHSDDVLAGQAAPEPTGTHIEVSTHPAGEAEPDGSDGE